METEHRWLRMSLWGAFWMIPPLLSFPFVRRNFGMPLDAVVCWYFVGVCVTVTALMARYKRAAELFPRPRSVIWQMLGIGMLFVGTAYGLQFWAVGIAPNPGLPTGLYSALGPVVFFSSIAVGKISYARFRQHFGSVTRSWTQVAGVLFIIPGGILIASGTAFQIGSWLGLTIAAIPLMAVGQLGIRWFKGEHRIAQDIVMVWYFVGTVAVLAGWIIFGGRGATLVTGWGSVVMLAVGLTSGAAGNWLLFRAVGDAPNPGLAYSVYSGSGIGTYLAAIFAAWILPGYFLAAQIDFAKLAGIVLVATGVSLIGGFYEFFVARFRAPLSQASREVPSATTLTPHVSSR